MKVVGISGSLRQGSFNTALIRSCGDLMPEGVDFEVLDWSDVPVYNEDLGTPDPVARIRAAIAAADAVLIATPEYNHSVPGSLKNTLDWLSRPAGKAVLTGKFCGIVSASTGAIGGARAQQHLKVILLAMGSPVFAGPEVLVGAAASKVADGRLSDEGTRRFLGDWLLRFTTWAAPRP